MKRIYAILVLTALSACGKLQSDKITPPHSSTSQYTLSPSALAAGCTQLRGVLSSDQTLCLVRTTVSITSSTAAVNGRIDIDPNFANGRFLVSSGTGVEILLNGRHVSDVNARILSQWGNGDLQFNVLTPSQANATASTYACYDRNLNSVWCNDGVIPH